jgi:tetraprenyl-beta-curcumene synthase
VSTRAEDRNGRAQVVEPAWLDARPRRAPDERLPLGGVFLATAARHLALVVPQVRRELGLWHERAAAIPEARLRGHALRALEKRGNIEGAALFATLAPAAHRERTARALIAFQTAYNYLDTLSELPGAQPAANGDQLHRALLSALHPRPAHVDYYAYAPSGEDGGYLHGLLDACREALAGLPSFHALAAAARAAAARIVDFQALNLTERQGGHDELERWATQSAPAGCGLEWWEIAAAHGSSLAVHALIAAAATPALDRFDAQAIDRAYFPWAGALHSLLDSLVDVDEDRAGGQRSLIGYYRSPAEASVRLAVLAGHARDDARRLPRAHAHVVILTAMCSYYLSARGRGAADTRALQRELGAPLRAAILAFRARRLLHGLSGRAYR